VDEAREEDKCKEHISPRNVLSTLRQRELNWGNITEALHSRWISCCIKIGTLGGISANFWASQLPLLSLAAIPSAHRDSVASQHESQSYR
jgi:hypothetical protein